MSLKKTDINERLIGMPIRFGSFYTLKFLSDLPKHLQEALNDVRKDPEFYGVLIPESADVSIKSVGRETALLLLTLLHRQSSVHVENGLQPVPGYFLRQYGTDAGQHLYRLLLDNIIDVEINGEILSGPEAVARLNRTIDVGKITQHDPSLQALQYAQKLPIDNVTKLSARLYFYNRIPLSPYWRHLFQSERRIRQLIGVSPDGSLFELMDENWRELYIAPPNDGWLMWKLKDVISLSRNQGPIYKLYINPWPDVINSAIFSIIQILTQMEVPQFKIGKTPHALLRPDKIVAYFKDFMHLQRTAAALTEPLNQFAVQPLPFTSPLDEKGMLSWGIDPPRSEQLIGWQEQETWRLWITNRLATSLILARQQGSREIEPWEFALHSLETEGVNTQTWEPMDLNQWMSVYKQDPEDFYEQ